MTLTASEEQKFTGEQPVHVIVQSITFPVSAWLDIVGVAGAADTSGNVQDKNYHVIENASSVAIDVFGSVDGSNYPAAAIAVEIHDDVTSTPSVTIPAGKIGIIRGKYKAIEIRQAAAGSIANGEIRGGHTNV